MESPAWLTCDWLAPPPSPRRASQSLVRHDETKSGDFYLAITGDLELATSGDSSWPRTDESNNADPCSDQDAGRRFERYPSVPMRMGGPDKRGSAMWGLVGGRSASC